MIHKVRVMMKDRDPRGSDLLREILATLDVMSVQEVRVCKVYRLEGVSEAQADAFARKMLCDPLTQIYSVNSDRISADGARRVEVAYKPGVMNPEAASLVKAARDSGLRELVAADSSWEYWLYGAVSDDELALIIDRLLVNKTVQHVVMEEPVTLLTGGEPGSLQLLPVLMLNNEALMELSRARSLFLNLEELQVIQRYFQEIGREPTDAELETFAQTWSEHCGHKTFKARLLVEGYEKPPLIERIKSTARRYFGDLVLSAFADNSGVIAFYDGWAVCGKVETHNSPSAIEPYGGAMTGSGGVFRDIMGTGQGAKVIASTDMFCFAPPDLSAEQLPAGCLHPRHLLRKVVAGVRDYGNRMGIPTNNGSVHFHPDFRAKPSVIVGAYGLLHADRCGQGEPRPGDAILVAGGRTGRDGIHGATFSSGEMTAETLQVSASAVQIGNAIEEKRLADALLRCRDEGLVRAITDCGAGGFSSAIGEMGARLGARVELERAPLKYAGLAPWEIWLSESQERMVVAATPEHVQRVLDICTNYNVQATVLGSFTDDRRLAVTYEGRQMCNLSMAFLHEGLPQRTMVATKPDRRRAAEPDFPQPDSPEAWARAYCAVLAHGNVCSKEPIVRMYDHSVQGTNVLSPFSGVQHDGPNDAVVLRPLPGKPYGLVIAHGLNPAVMRIDPYAGSLWAAVEALSNFAAVGGNVRQAALIDNFIWPFPDEESLWELDRAVDACCAIMECFKIPFVSGKDSLSSTYRRGDFVLKIPPVLCVSVFGRIPDVRRTVTADFKEEGSHIVLVGSPDRECLGGSVYYDVHGRAGGCAPQLDVAAMPALFDWLYRHITAGHILACHDISHGGLASALAEMCFGGDCGAFLDEPAGEAGRLDHWLFHETAGTFLLEVPDRFLDALLRHLRDSLTCTTCKIIGRVTGNREITVWHRGPRFTVLTEKLKAAWQQPMKEVFHS